MAIHVQLMMDDAPDDSIPVDDKCLSLHRDAERPSSAIQPAHGFLHIRSKRKSNMVRACEISVGFRSVSTDTEDFRAEAFDVFDMRREQTILFGTTAREISRVEEENSMILSLTSAQLKFLARVKRKSKIRCAVADAHQEIPVLFLRNLDDREYIVFAEIAFAVEKREFDEE